MSEEELQVLVEQLSLNYFYKPFRHTARFNSRLRTTGGRYLLISHDIEINPRYVSHGSLEEVEGIIKHELVHYHLHLEGRGYKHGDQEFKQLLKEVGAPRFCRAISDTKQKKRPHIHLYRCLKCSQNYSRKIRMNTDKYRCSKCSGRLEYGGIKKL
ncbi:SprT family protein [Chryseomicrobium aureum]|uniref:SprT family protein n=1 Tax=Chryseomicrobium aureum TaxID=1441723 RepID=UPI00370D7452